MKQVKNAHGYLAAGSSVQVFDPVKRSVIRGIILLLFACAMLLFISFRSEGAPNHYQKGNTPKKPVPFKGKETVDLNIGLGIGEATHIGHFTHVGKDDDSNFPMLTGTTTFTAANGDQLFTTHIGYAQELGNGRLQVNFKNYITGGTGRFAGATGSFEEDAVLNETTNIARAIIYDGTISY